MATLHFQLSASFLNQHIQNLIDEKKYSLAYRTVSSAISESDIDPLVRIGLVIGILDGSYEFSGEKCNEFSIIETGNVKRDFVFDSLHELESIKDENEDSINDLSVKLNSIYASLIDQYPQALREACIYYREEHGGFLYGDTSIEAGIMDSYKSMRPELSDMVEDYLKVQNSDVDSPYGWLCPDGTFYEVEWGKHREWAYQFIKENANVDIYFDGIDNFYDPGDYLVLERGWVLLHNPARGVGKCTISRYHKLTLGQKEFLYNYYTKFNLPECVDAVKHNYMQEIPKYFDIID